MLELPILLAAAGYCVLMNIRNSNGGHGTPPSPTKVRIRY